MGGVTLDSGALIAFERGQRRIIAHLKETSLRGIALTVPTVVIAEVWRGRARSARLAALFEACTIEPLAESLARVAGEALGRVKGASLADAIVMASAAQRGDRVLTADPGDLLRLRTYFLNTRVVAI